MLKKVIFAFLMVCLLAVPGSAWHLSFEGHSNELSQKYYSLEQASIEGNGVNSYIFFPGSGSGYISKCKLNISYTDYLSFTVYPGAGTKLGYYGLKIYDADDNLIFDDTQMITIDYAHTPFRAEFIETSSGTAIEAYKDGVLSDATSYRASGQPARMEITYFSDNLKGYIDDISNEKGVVGTDYELRSTDEYQYYTLGFPFVSNSSWYATIYDPNGYAVNNTSYLNNSQSTTDASPLGTYKIARANLSQGGTYIIRLYRHDFALNSNVFYGEELFFYDLPANGSINLDKSEVVAGDTVRISSNIKSFENGYFVYFETSSKSGEKFVTRYDIKGEVGSEVNDISYATINKDSITGNTIVYLIDPLGNVVDYATLDIEATFTGTPSLSLDKTIYQANDTVKISYKNAPYGSSLNLRLRSGSTGVLNEGWQIIDGSGTKTYKLGSIAADNMILTLKNKEGKIIASDSADILSGNFQLSGRVFDAKTGSAVEGATVQVSGNTVVTDSAGNYGINAIAGKNSVTIDCTEYNKYYGFAPVYDMFTNKNFWIVPTSTYSGSSVYGVVTSSGTGVPLKGVRISLSNSTDSFTKYTNEYGYYAIEGISNGTYTVRVILSNYDIQQKQISVEGNTYQSFRLVANEGYKEEGSDPDSGSGNIVDNDNIDTTNYSNLPYGAYGRHAFDFDGDGKVSGDEWRYAVEHLSVALGCLMFLGFLTIVTRAGRR